MEKWLKSSVCTATIIFSAASAFAAHSALAPNDKLVAPKGCGLFHNVSKNQPLTYIVRFQNTGTGPAHDVVIRDVIDNDLDITTLKNLASSHNITHIEIIPDNALIISYEGIELPDSGSNPLGSNGFVAFSIKPKNNLPDGTTITNQAGIYFDFNEVVLTNSTLNTLRDNPEPIADFTSNHSCTNTGLVYDFTYTGSTVDSATFFWDFGTGATPQTSTQQNPSGVVFAFTGTKQVTLTVTRFGCTASITKAVEIINVSCGNNKVVICHKPPGNQNNPQTICISKNALQAHLNHGDCIGACVQSSNRISDVSFPVDDNVIFEAHPNPFTDKTEIIYSVSKNSHIKIRVYNYLGTLVSELFNADVQNADAYKLNFNSNELSSGIYYATLENTGAYKVIKLVIIK